MTLIYMPSDGPDAWKRFLAKPDLHWATGYSARTLAHCWEEAAGIPPEIDALLAPVVGPSRLLLAIPEHKVPLPGGSRESQCDVFALIRARDQVIAMAVEGKVDEPFGPTVGEWLQGASGGKLQRLAYICEILGLPAQLDPGIRYQLLHRTASAVVEAQRFLTRSAAMVVHSFSPNNRWFEDYARFAALFGHEATVGRLSTASLPCGRRLHLGWASGDQRFRIF